MAKQFQFLDSYAPIFYEDKTYWIISGGRASGKSTNIAAYFVMKLMGDEYFRGVIARYTQRALTTSIYRDIVDIINDWGIASFLEVKGDEIRNIRNDNMIITHSMKLQEGTMTARGKGLARVSALLVDEATELPNEVEYVKLIDSFRTKGIDRKIFLLFNPTSKNHWIFRRFYNPDGTPNPRWAADHGYIHTTYHDNAHNLDPKKIDEWERSKLEDPAYYDHHILGKWADIGEGNVFKTWKFDWNPDPEAEEIYAIDFGFASDPCAVIRVLKRGKRLWIEELVYASGLTNQDLADALEAKGVSKTATIYADSAEPKSIEELRRLGYRNIRAAAKGPDSIRAGIKKLHGFEIHANPASKNLLNEYQFYSYKPGTDKPIDDHNHLMDSLRYALSKHRDGPVIALPNMR
jgi:phage terminase large subunit